MLADLLPIGLSFRLGQRLTHLDLHVERRFGLAIHLVVAMLLLRGLDLLSPVRHRDKSLIVLDSPGQVYARSARHGDDDADPLVGARSTPTALQMLCREFAWPTSG